MERLVSSGNDVLLDIDVQGAKQVVAAIDAVTVFIAPPSIKELERRLRGRGSEEEDVVALRLENARVEIEQADMYEYFIINDQLDEAVDSLCSIIKAHRCKMRRNLAGDSLILS